MEEARGKTILIVDDDQEMVGLVKTLLENKGYLVQSSLSGVEALAFLEREKPDLIILDITMPQMDGLEVLARLKENRGICSIPVILLTALGRYEDVLRGYRMGAEYYVVKPFNSLQLLNAVRRVLKWSAPSVEEKHG